MDAQELIEAVKTFADEVATSVPPDFCSALFQQCDTTSALLAQQTGSGAGAPPPAATAAFLQALLDVKKNTNDFISNLRSLETATVSYTWQYYLASGSRDNLNACSLVINTAATAFQFPWAKAATTNDLISEIDIILVKILNVADSIKQMTMPKTINNVAAMFRDHVLSILYKYHAMLAFFKELLGAFNTTDKSIVDRFENILTNYMQAAPASFFAYLNDVQTTGQAAYARIVEATEAASLEPAFQELRAAAGALQPSTNADYTIQTQTNLLRESITTLKNNISALHSAHEAMDKLIEDELAKSGS